VVDEASFMRSLFKSYYEGVAGDIKPPSSLERREFAFMLFGREEMLRHVWFRRAEELASFIRSEAPAHIYYSSAYYSSPWERDMELKGWVGADLVFDIDADHIPTPCKGEHDRWECLDCGAQGRGLEPERCPSCGGRRIKAHSFYLCARCLEAAKSEVIKLVEDFLIPDLGFSPREIHVAFSGRRGYHVHIESEAVRELDQYARRELVDYVKAVSLKPEAHGYHHSIDSSPSPPTLNSPGWRGRIARGIYSIISGASREELRSMAPPVKRRAYGRSFWSRLVERAIKLQRCEVDERVTTDVRRLIRLPGSLHGDTGLIAKALSLNDLEYAY